MSNESLAIDINSDVGERPNALRDGSEEKLMRFISSANIACGGHAGDADTMEKTVQLALKHHVGVGAHPGYPDRKNFGRVEMRISLDEISAAVYEQLRQLAIVCKKFRCELIHVKPHGALYSVAVNNYEVARAIANGVRKWSADPILVGLANSQMLQVWEDAGFRVAGEAFVDRAYEANGTLRSREYVDALITDPHEAAERAVAFLRGITTSIGGTIIHIKPITLCVHGDTPNSPDIAGVVKEALIKAGIAVRPLRELV